MLSHEVNISHGAIFVSTACAHASLLESVWGDRVASMCVGACADPLMSRLCDMRCPPERRGAARRVGNALRNIHETRTHALRMPSRKLCCWKLLQHTRRVTCAHTHVCECVSVYVCSPTVIPIKENNDDGDDAGG